MNAVSGSLAGCRLLIVEDETVVTMLLADMLVTLGCEVIASAQTVATALEILNGTTALDAAILDVNLGGEKVWPVADALNRREISFIFCTGYGLTGIDVKYA